MTAAFRCNDKAITFEKYLKSHSGRAFAGKNFSTQGLFHQSNPMPSCTICRPGNLLRYDSLSVLLSSRCRTPKSRTTHFAIRRKIRTLRRVYPGRGTTGSGAVFERICEGIGAEDASRMRSKINVKRGKFCCGLGADGYNFPAYMNLDLVRFSEEIGDLEGNCLYE